MPSLKALVALLLLALARSPAHADFEIRLLHIPLVLKADDDRIETQAAIEVPLIPFSPGGEDPAAFASRNLGSASGADLALASYIEGVRTNDKVLARKYALKKASTIDGRFSVEPSDEISPFERQIFFSEKPEQAPRLFGKIPFGSGAYYLIARGPEEKGAWVLPVVETEEGPKVSAIDPYGFFNILASSLPRSRLTESPLWKNAPTAPAGTSFGKADLDRFFHSRISPAALAPILAAVDGFGSNLGKESFTPASQETFNKDYTAHKEKDVGWRTKEIRSRAARMREIAYVLDFDPIFISVQKNPSTTDDEKFTYLKGKDGVLRLTNLDVHYDFDHVFKTIPLPPEETLKAFAQSPK